MTIETTPKDIRALLELAKADRGADRLAPEARRQAREAALRRVPRRLLDRYELLREAGRTPVVVPIERGACSGCHVRLPVVVELAARRAPAVHTCSHCRRMLYATELVRDDSRAADGGPPRRVAPAAGRRS